MNAKRLLLAVLIFSASVIPSTLFGQTRSLKRIQVGVPAISMGNIIIFFAKEAKIYEKHGLDAEPVVMSGSGIASRALTAGSVVISPIATPAVMNAVLAEAQAGRVYRRQLCRRAGQERFHQETLRKITGSP